MAQQRHSAIFDELAVMTASQINQPNLAQLTRRLQASLLPSQLSLQALSLDEVSAHQSRYCQDLLQALYQTPLADASVLVAITNEARPRLLLTRRAGHLNAHAGEVSFAGGKYEPIDGNNVVTALREACEETALPTSQVHIIGQLPTQTSKSGMSVRPIVALIPPSLTLVPELGEISRIFWADFESLIQQPVQEYAIDYKVKGEVMTLLTPCWQVEGETVWGLTGRIIASLLEIGFDRQIEWYYRAQA